MDCSSCFFGVRVSVHQGSQLECRRRAPQPNMDPRLIHPSGRSSYGVYPVPEGPCGEFRAGVERWKLG